MRIAICDDIPECRISIKEYAEEYFINHHIKAEMDEYDSGTALINSKDNFDILFLDIELGDSNGIDIAKEIQSRHKNTVVLIITSYRQYLDAAMDINVTRYINKPITQSKIHAALDKALSVINESIITLNLKDNRMLRLKQSEIVFAEAKLKNVTVYCRNEHFKVKETMKQLRSLLVASCFAVPHNSYIVNLNYVKSFKRNEICLAEPYSDVKISIASRKQPEFKRKFLDFVGEDIVDE